MSTPGSNSTGAAGCERPVDLAPAASSPPAITWAFVTTSPSAATNPLPSWISSHACSDDSDRARRAPARNARCA